MADVAALGISVDSKQAVAAAGDLDKLSAASGRAETSTQKLARSIGASEAQMARYAAIATRVGAAVAAASVAAAGALALIVKRTLENVDEQAKLARQLGGTIDGLRGLQIAAADAGVDTGALASSLGRFQAVLGEAERGTGTAVDALARLNLSAADLSALDIDERLAVIVERMDGLGLSASQSADLLRQFGIRNSEVLRLVQGGADAIRAARREVDEYGLSISQVDAAAIERANDAMGRISRVAEVFATRLTVALAPALEAVSNWLNELTRQNGGWRDSAQGAAAGVVEALIWVVEAYDELNKAGARFQLLFDEMQESSAKLGISARGLLGFDPTQVQLDILATAEAQRQFVAELESSESLADMLRQKLEEVRAAAAATASDSAEAGAFVGDLDAIKDAAEAYKDLRQEMARAIELARADVLDARDQEKLADEYRNAVEWQDALAKGEGHFNATRQENLAAQLKQLQAIRAEAEILQQVEELRTDVQTDKEAATSLRDDRLEMLREALEMEAITKAEYRELEKAAIAEFNNWEYEQLAEKYDKEQELAERQRESERRVAADITSIREAAMNNAVGFLQVLGQKSKLAAIAAIALNKGLMIAQTIQSGAAAEIRALAELGYVAGSAAAAQIRAWTIANVALIAGTGLAQAMGSGSTRSSGGSPGGGGSVAPAAAAPTPAPAAPAQDVTIRIDSNRNIFTRADIQQIIEGISDAVGDGANLRLASA